MNSETKKDLNAALTILDATQSAMENLGSIKRLIESAVNSLSGPVRWVNVYEKNSGTAFAQSYAGNEMYPEEQFARYARGRSNGASKNKYLGAFPVLMSGQSTPTQVLFEESKNTSLADMSYAQQQEVLIAASLYYEYKSLALLPVTRRKINTIKHIRFITNCSLIESKQLVDYALNSSLRPEWFKDKP